MTRNPAEDWRAGAPPCRLPSLSESLRIGPGACEAGDGTVPVALRAQRNGAVGEPRRAVIPRIVSGLIPDHREQKPGMATRCLAARLALPAGSGQRDSCRIRVTIPYAAVGLHPPCPLFRYDGEKGERPCQMPASTSHRADSICESIIGVKKGRLGAVAVQLFPVSSTSATSSASALAGPSSRCHSQAFG